MMIHFNHIFVSLSSYLLGKVAGQEQAVAAMKRDLANPESKPALAGLDTVKRLHDLCDITLLLDSGSSHLSMHRCHQFWKALQDTQSEAWVSVDDDVELSPRTAKWLLQSIEGCDPRIVIAPCLLRNSRTVNIDFAKVVTTRALPDGGITRRCTWGGFGCVAMNRHAMTIVAETAPQFRDDDSVMKPAPFYEILDDGRWYGEDISFFERVNRLSGRILVDALISGETTHGGQRLDLGTLAGV